ncbi:exodeoxyribonuclease V subunit gamma [Lentisphaera marina]|uniref:exodeoxyribonuclease V subunit gamma n=1 Tax=Lentisphaera marina TaxID=1111041 RepID=UPI0023664BC7|nr:exodeoxyribonuclease V subunit gamma [Lentisphaera marina]MDD7986671.1 exodeoxyribonuclease V subunit gamma [Lentisphaera marina]
MKIFASNRLETLAARLADSLVYEKSSPDQLFSKANDLVIIQSRGMAKWVDLQIADKNNIATRIDYPFIRTFISRILVKCGYSPKEDIWDRESLTWRIFNTLPQVEERFTVINDYVKKNNSLRYQLAEQLSSLIDEYMIYRQDWLNAWEKGFNAKQNFKELGSSNEEWQKYLWQILCKDEQNSFQNALNNFFESDFQSLPDLELPHKISIFGITNMPPVFITFFEKLSENHQVTLYHFNPCQEYWGDVKKDQFSGIPIENNPSLGLKDSIFFREEENQVPDLPHSLLKSMGLLGRDFLNLLIENTNFDSLEDYTETSSDKLLHRIQNGILNMSFEFESKLAVDKSISINACHSPRRELEVLHDYLVEVLESDPELRPQDIVVMAPNIQDYAPHISGVFSHPDDNPIEFSISDQQVSSRPLVTSFLKVLKLHKTRLTANNILEIIECPEFLEAFNLEIDAIGTIRTWLEETRIRWAKDEKQRKEWGLPEFEQNSWKFGLDRLLSGYAFDDTLIYENSLVYPVAGDGLLLGKFKSAVDALFKIHSTLEKEKLNLLNWSAFFAKSLEECFIKSPDSQNEYYIILQSLQKMTEHSEFLDPDKVFEADVAIKALETSLQEQNSSHGFISRGITFCSLLPMRSIPVKVICMIGLNEGAYPRHRQRTGFDLMSRHWRQGDRTMNLDDRYLFLESLISARDKFYLSYIGKSNKDNEEIPPSVILAEFIDYLNKITSDFKVQKHKLNVFNPHYFYDQSEVKSFSRLHYQAAQSLAHQKDQSDFEFCPDQLELPKGIRDSEGYINIQLNDLANFFKSPAKTFLKNQLGTALWKEEISELAETEAFEQVDSLEKWKLKDQILTNILTSQLPEEELENHIRAQVLADGLLPYADRGEECFNEVYSKSNDLAQKILPFIEEHEEDQVNFTLKFTSPDKLKLHCSISQIYSSNYLSYHCGADKQKHYMSKLISYLALIQKRPELHLKFCNEEHVHDLSPSTQSSKALEEILALYLEGLRKPLNFFPECYQEYFEKRQQTPPADHDTAMQAAADKWPHDTYNNPFADSTKAENKVCFGKDFPHDSASATFEAVYNIVESLKTKEVE